MASDAHSDRSVPPATAARARPAARLLVVDADDRLLLFSFVLPDRRFWATVGGAVEAGETFAEAARRELFEETGLSVEDVGVEVARRTAVFEFAGSTVNADERFFLVRVGGMTIDRTGHQPDERDVIVEHRWWTQAELAATGEQVWPENLDAMLRDIGVWPEPRAAV